MLNAEHVRSSSRAPLARLPTILDALLADLDVADWRARPIPGSGRPMRPSSAPRGQQRRMARATAPRGCLVLGCLAQ